MQAVILCAGFGTRLRPITDNIPKVMVPIGGRPLLWHQIEHFKEHGVKEFFINLHHLPDVIKNYFGDGSEFGVKIIYSHEPKILGTGGGLKKFEFYLRDDFFVLYGDVYSRVNYSQLLSFYREKSPCLGAQVVAETEHPLDSDSVFLDENLRFKKIYQKPHKEQPAVKRYDMQGIYVFNKNILQNIPSDQYYEIDHQLLPGIIAQGEAYYGYLARAEDCVQDVGTHDRYKKVAG